MTETTFGSRTVARSLFDHYAKANDIACYTDAGEFIDPPAGFKFLGAGCFRIVFLHEDSNLVYKLGNYNANVFEAHTSRRLRSRSKRGLDFEVKIPRTRTFAMPAGIGYRGQSFRQAVTAQEFAANGRHTYCESQNDWMDVVPDCDCNNTPCFAHVLSTISRWSSLTDIHGENVLMDESDVFWLIDMGM